MRRSQLASTVGCHRSTITLLLQGRRKASGRLAVRLTKAVHGTSVINWLFADKYYQKLKKLVEQA